jgi:hypothetical protein
MWRPLANASASITKPVRFATSNINKEVGQQKPSIFAMLLSKTLRQANLPSRWKVASPTL